MNLKQAHQRNTPEEYNRRWIARVLSKTTTSSTGCILWQGFKGHGGYGQHYYRGRNGHIHRLYYQVIKGVKLGKFDYACHRCDVRTCINPDHIFIAGPADNQRDMKLKGRSKYSPERYTHCKHGHEFTPENTRITAAGARACKTCARIKCRLAAGWPLELATSMPPSAKGSRPVNAQFTLTRKRESNIVVRSSLTAAEIRELLNQGGLSQCGAARKIGISERSMRRYVAGEIPMPENAASALKALLPAQIGNDELVKNGQ